MGTIERLWVKRFAGGPMDPVDELEIALGTGIVGNADQKPPRHVTILSAERWERVCDELGEDVDPVLRRANVVVRGLDLVDSRGRELALGGARLVIRGETRPCRLMEESHAGLQAALDADWGGGAYAEVVAAGTVRVGDAALLLT